MKIKVITVIIALMFTLAAALAAVASAASGAAAAAAEPGSTADPIALKSYVDSQIAELETRLTAMMQGAAQGAAQGATQQQPSAPININESDIGANQSMGSSFIPIETFANQRVMLGEGTEMVLRTGSASAIHGEFGALVDLISGQDLEAGESVPINHLILSPRDDNRGIRISEDAWVLIKGAYEIR